MGWRHADERFGRHVASLGTSLDDATASDVVALVVDWYVSDPATGVVAVDGDMLLFEWGTYDWGSGPTFQYGITRQLIRRHRLLRGESIWQVSATAHLAVEVGADLGRGDRWCHSASDVEPFNDFIRDAVATRVVADLAPDRVELTWEPAD